MDFETLFGLFYTKYRGEESPPTTTDPEWAIAVRNYNDALMRMSHFDDTKWNFMYETLQDVVQVSPVLVKTLSTGDTTYTAPANMSEPGGYVTFIDTNDGRNNYPLLQPHEIQSITSTSQAAYFTGDRNSGYVLHLNVAPTATENGYGLDYTYYKKPTLLDPDTEGGTSIIAGGDPSFYYNHMLAQRFLDSRNIPAYQISKRDAEEALKGMKLKNNSGTWFNAWSMQDTGPGFGI